MSDSGNIDPAQAAELLHTLTVGLTQAQVVSYTTIAAAAWICYDVVLKFGTEVELIWKCGFMIVDLPPRSTDEILRRSKWSSVKVLYLLCRYYGPIFLIVSTGGETSWFKQSPKFPIHARIVLLVVEFALELWVSLSIYIDIVKNAEQPLPYVRGCLSGDTLSDLIAGFFFTATVAHAYKTVSALSTNGPEMMRSSSHVSVTVIKGSTGKVSPYKLLVTIVTDGASHYLSITSILLVATLTVRFAPGAYVSISIPWLCAVYSFAGTRLILNLRKAVLKHNTMATWQETVAMETVPPRTSLGGIHIHVESIVHDGWLERHPYNPDRNIMFDSVFDRRPTRVTWW
ncbi:hypothetical protein EIP91_007288 [Steccherinum ochraceum]|uniref:DUF6533 domain-containing protein n=1 Tax=Steccherinum ochraceum TaxID=92696 RepID=A0A4R0R6R1_9APHY|nr:hypothetical protein EIP91_007288 [Steccherinum ochraceum]